MEIDRATRLPVGLAAAIKALQFRYAAPLKLYHLVSWLDSFVGVVGDGANGCYEWFIWWSDSKHLQMSDTAYGSDFWALRDGVIVAAYREEGGDPHFGQMVERALEVGRKRSLHHGR